MPLRSHIFHLSDKQWQKEYILFFLSFHLIQSKNFEGESLAQVIQKKVIQNEECIGYFFYPFQVLTKFEIKIRVGYHHLM